MAKTAAASRQPNQKSCYQRPHPLEEDLAWHLDGEGKGRMEGEREREREIFRHEQLSVQSFTSNCGSLIKCTIKSPEVRCPVGVAETPLEGEKPRQHLTKLPLGKWSNHRLPVQENSIIRIEKSSLQMLYTATGSPIVNH